MKFVGKEAKSFAEVQVGQYLGSNLLGELWILQTRIPRVGQEVDKIRGPMQKTKSAIIGKICSNLQKSGVRNVLILLA